MRLVGQATVTWTEFKPIGETIQVNTLRTVSTELLIVSTLFLICRHTCAHKGNKRPCSTKSCAIRVLHGVPEAPCADPKYYTQTVAITPKPEIPHSTFLIPAARLLSWAPHEEPLLEREGSCISPVLSVCLFLSLSLSLSPLLVSPPKYLTVTLSVCDSPSVLLFLPLSALSSSPLLIPPLLHCALSPTLPLTVSYGPWICWFISLYASLSFLSPTDAVCPWLSFPRQDFYFASFSFVSLPFVLPLSLCVSRYSCRDFLTC